MWTGDKPSEHGRWGAATYISKHKDDTLICQWSIAEPSLDFVACYCKLNFNLLFVCLITALLNVQELSISLLAFRLVFPKAGHRAIGRVVSWDHGCKLQDVQTFWFRGQRPWGADQLCRAINRLFACTLLLHDVVTFHIFWTCFLIRGVRRPSWRRFSNVQSFSLDLQYKRQKLSVASTIPEYSIRFPFRLEIHLLCAFISPWCVSFLSQFDEANCAHCIQYNISHLLESYGRLTWMMLFCLSLGRSCHPVLAVQAGVAQREGHMHWFLACMRSCLCSFLLHLWFWFDDLLRIIPIVGWHPVPSTGH